MPLRTSIVLRNPPLKKRKTKVRKPTGVKKMATRKRKRRRRSNQMSLANPTKRRRTRRRRRRNPTNNALSVGRGRSARRPRNMTTTRTANNPRRRRRYKKRRNPARRRTYRRNQMNFKKAFSGQRLWDLMVQGSSVAIGTIIGKMGSNFIRKSLPPQFTGMLGNFSGLIGVTLGVVVSSFAPKNKNQVVKNIGLGMIAGGVYDMIEALMPENLKAQLMLGGDLYPYGASSHALMGADTSLLGSGASIYGDDPSLLGADTSLLGHEYDPYDMPAI